MICMSDSQVNKVQNSQEMGEGDMSSIQNVEASKKNNEPQLGHGYRIK